MTPRQQPALPSRLLARVAVAGMSVAILALGTLAIWAAIITQNDASDLTHAGVQTSGHLRAIQALSIIDTSSDNLEKGIVPRELATLRMGQRVLDDALGRMEDGNVRQARQLAAQAKPLMRRFKPRIERFLARPPGYDSSGTTGPEKAMEDTMVDLQVLLNNLESDPSEVLITKLEYVSESERTVRATAFVLIPLGLGGVVVCGFLLGSYRRRSEAIMRDALDVTSEEARTDQLTGLPNRRALLEEFERRSSGNQSFTLTLADLNGFKRYNDTFGHAAGDALLRRLGRKLASASEGRGIAARLGGDEFCVIFFKETSSEEARALIRVALSEAGDGFRITAASGVASVPRDAGDPEGALGVADARMCAAKVDALPSTEQETS
jgi:diguanylate cyclase (GGDEF)-like protein